MLPINGLQQHIFSLEDKMPRDVWGYLFSACDLSFRDLTAASLVCKRWKELVELPVTGRRLLQSYQVPLEERPWMEAFRCWVVAARYFCLLDISGSMGRADNLSRTRLERGKDVVRSLAYHIMDVARDGLFLGTVSNSWQLIEAKRKEEASAFLETISENHVGYSLKFHPIIKVIIEKIKGVGVSHLHLISDCDIEGDPFFSLGELLPPGVTLRIYFHKIGYNRNGLHFLNEQKELKRKFEVMIAETEKR